MNVWSQQSAQPDGRIWRVVGASVRGAVHIRRGTPNQDAIACRRHEDSVLLAVADGHGAPQHYRSDIGAAYAVETALQCLEDRTFPLDDLPAAIVAAWRKAVLAHAGAQEGDDWILPEEEQVLAYGSTLLAVRIASDVIAVQIGDGDILFGGGERGVWRPLPDDADTPGESTHSLCQSNAPARFRSVRLDGEAVDFVMLSTDGLGKSFASEADLFKVAETYRAQACSGELERIGRDLEAWLEEASRRGSGDDATLLVAGAPSAPGSSKLERTSG